MSFMSPSTSSKFVARRDTEAAAASPESTSATCEHLHRDRLYICIQISGQFAACVSSRVPFFHATGANRKKKIEEEEEETKLDKILFTRVKRTKITKTLLQHSSFTCANAFPRGEKVRERGGRRSSRENLKGAHHQQQQ
ncbi:unnamed protein product [Trichogramma brassicae]|uniref:Uncharacterized protein n=1 Tax=Trichogramma brassicae TaxID=86971 RepID=A0A6H5HSK3_9HYME|nr:unnamed protein product [Trichogramma brassicae]